MKLEVGRIRKSFPETTIWYWSCLKCFRRVLCSYTFWSLFFCSNLPELNVYFSVLWWKNLLAIAYQFFWRAFEDFIFNLLEAFVEGAVCTLKSMEVENHFFRLFANRPHIGQWIKSIVDPWINHSTFFAIEIINWMKNIHHSFYFYYNDLCTKHI